MPCVQIVYYWWLASLGTGEEKLIFDELHAKKTSISQWIYLLGVTVLHNRAHTLHWDNVNILSHVNLKKFYSVIWQTESHKIFIKHRYGISSQYYMSPFQHLQNQWTFSIRTLPLSSIFIIIVKRDSNRNI